MSAVLEACHFCGERDADFVNRYGKVAVQCVHCEAQGPWGLAFGKQSARESALDQWNGISLRRRT